MKSKISIFALSFATVCMVSSCLGDTDNTEEAIYYDDTAITGMTLGTLLRKSNSSDKESNIDKDGMVAFDGKSYPLTINQYAGTITNAPDSLPVGTDLSKVIISGMTTLNNGSVALDSITAWSSAQTLDFSKPRALRVWSSSGKYSRKYIVTLVAHKEVAEDFSWNALDADNDIKGYSGVKSVVCNGRLVVLGNTASGTEMKALVDGNWKKVKTFGAGATMTSDGTQVYVADGGNINVTSDLTNWQSISANVKSVLGVCGNELFAMSTSNKMMVSLDKGNSWTEDAIDDDAKYLPSSDINFIATDTKGNDDIKRAFFIGNSASSANAVVWSKIIEEDPAKDQAWMYQAFEERNKYALQKLSNLSVIQYADVLVAFGGKYDKIYASADNGITWKEDDKFKMPTGFSADAASIATDDKGYVWIVCTGSGQVWKGRINQLGWENK